MQELVVKCDICLSQIEEGSAINSLQRTLTSGLRQDGISPAVFNWKDICPKCSFALVKLLKDFKEQRMGDVESNE